MERVRNLLYFKQMNKLDYFYSISLVVTPILILLSLFITKWFYIIGILIIYFLILLMNLLVLENPNYESLPKDYKLLVGLGLLTTIGMFIYSISIATNINENSSYFELIVFISGATFFIYLWEIGLILKAILVLIYYLLLKIYFKYQEDEGDDNDYVSVEELSKYIKIKDQVKVFNTIIINLILYFGGVIYFMLWLISVIELDGEIYGTLNAFAKEYNYTNFGNTIGLFSLIITVYTVTFSIQRNIFDKALQAYHLDKDGEIDEGRL